MADSRDRCLGERLTPERRELTIPLGIATRVGFRTPALRQQLDDLVGEFVAEAAGEGWVPDEPLDLNSLEAAGRLDAYTRPGTLATDHRVIRSARVWFRRAAASTRDPSGLTDQ